MDVEMKTVLDAIAANVQSLVPRIETLDTNQKSLQGQLDAMTLETQKPRGGIQTKSIAQEVFESPEIQHLAGTGGRGRVAIRIPDFQKKAAITNTGLGSYTTGIMMGERASGIVPAATRTFRVRELLRVVPTTAGAIDFVKVTGYSQASPQVEDSNKLEASITFESESERIKTLAHWVPISNQALQDLPALEETVNVHLLAGLYDEEDEQLLSGDGTGENLHGLIPQANSIRYWPSGGERRLGIRRHGRARDSATGDRQTPRDGHRGASGHLVEHLVDEG
jgi:HK97 family phage major capsid protein